jgi:uncharacterized protein (DUF2164 family)
VSIELSREARAQALTSIERYFNENMEQRIGNIAAGALLTFFLEEIGPTVYNKAVAEVQEHMQARVIELDIEVHEEEFQYWPRQAKAIRATLNKAPGTRHPVVLLGGNAETGLMSSSQRDFRT